MATWIHMLKDDPLPWVLEENTPAVRHLALRQLLDQPENATEVRHASAVFSLQSTGSSVSKIKLVAG